MLRPRLRPRLLAFLIGTGSLILGCGQSVVTPPPGGDGGGPVDAGPPELQDSDADGLCDLSELSRGTDPLDGDTDGDGFGDLVETQLGYDALRPSSPDREIVIQLEQRAGATVTVPIEATVRGEGGDYTGAFELVGAPDHFGLDASDFYVSSQALYADPMSNVALVEPEAQRFRAVDGITRLFFEIELGFGLDLQVDCIRGYSFRYSVKRSDGRYVAIRRHLLVIVPEGETLGEGEWCIPEPPCR